jgi:hypothetical protein
MPISFEEYKNKLSIELGDYRSHKILITQIESLYNVEDFKYFYPKNIFNEKEIELYIFLEDGFVHCTIEEDLDEIHHYYGKPVSKHFTSPANGSKKVLLNVLYDNGKELLFDSREDSDFTWHHNYVKQIRELYKIL